MSRLITLICLLAILFVGTQAIKCYFGFADGKNPTAQFLDNCRSDDTFCGTIYDFADNSYIATCDDYHGCTQEGTFNQTYYTFTCCKTDGCNKLN